MIERLTPEDHEIGETFKRYLRTLMEHYRAQDEASRHGETHPEFGDDFEYWRGIVSEATPDETTLIFQAMTAAVIQTVQHYRRIDQRE